MIPLKDNVPSKRIPVVNYLLIALNAFIFFVGLGFSPAQLQTFIREFAVVPSELLKEFPANSYTVVTAMFLHGGWMHFLGNMLYLYIFGDNVEDRFGHFNYLLFYLFSGIAAFAVQLLFMLRSNVPLIGASGAIAGVLGAYLILYPRAKVITLVLFVFFFRIVSVPATLFLGLWFLIQIFHGTVTIGAASGVAWWAHIGGFACGAILARLTKRRFLML